VPKIEYKNYETVPKKLALCFVDISNYFYFNEGYYSEEESNRMEYAASFYLKNLTAEKLNNLEWWKKNFILK
jgi:hypothetical protein